MATKTGKKGEKKRKSEASEGALNSKKKRVSFGLKVATNEDPTEEKPEPMEITPVKSILKAPKTQVSRIDIRFY